MMSVLARLLSHNTWESAEKRAELELRVRMHELRVEALHHRLEEVEHTLDETEANESSY